MSPRRRPATPSGRMSPRVYAVPFGSLSIDEAVCSGCGACVPACPHGLIGLGGEGAVARLEEPDGCTACSACGTVCPVGAIALRLAGPGEG